MDLEVPRSSRGGGTIHKAVDAAFLLNLDGSLPALGREDFLSRAWFQCPGEIYLLPLNGMGNEERVPLEQV